MGLQVGGIRPWGQPLLFCSTIFWLSMAWVEPGHASLGGCWILAQHGMGGACLCAGFWLSMAWVEPGHASLGGCWHGLQIAPTPCHVTSQLPFSSPAEALLGAGRSPGWARERFRRIKLLKKIPGTLIHKTKLFFRTKRKLFCKTWCFTAESAG